MPSPASLPRLLTVSAPLVLAITLTIAIGGTSFPSHATPKADHAGNLLTEHVDLSAQLIARLIKAGWSRQAATAVVELNAVYFSIKAEYPEQLEILLQQLDRLGQFENLALMPRIERHPEFAALYAGAPIPIELDRAFVNDDCAGVYAGMFQLIIDPHEQDVLVDAFQRYGRNICVLGAMGITAPAAVFMFDHERPGAREYARWLNETVARALRASQPDDAVAEIMALALNQGEYLRNRLNQDSDFRRHFRTRLWPAFARVTDCSNKPGGECDTPLELLAEEPRVWDLLMQDRGEELLAQGGLLAVELLTEPPSGVPFPKDLHPLVRESLLQGNNETLSALIRFQNEPLFHRLMLRDDLDPSLRQRILGDLSSVCPEGTPQCPDLERRLRALGGFTLATLREDLAPEPTGLTTWIPLYDTYYTARKLSQGRDVSALDIAFVGLDVIDIFTLGKGKLMTQALKKGGKTIAMETAESITKKSAKKILKSSSPDFFKKAAESGRLMTAASKSYLVKSINLAKLSDQSMNMSRGLEITKPVQWVFEKTSIGRSSMKKITGLEARVFMRRDARVIVNYRNRYTNYLTEEFAINAALEQAEEIGEITINAWQKHASIWWFENSTTH
ncbi:MAG: hypothetical protein VBE63_20525 [Lamprobacter sp.]|uniref:hypothetical protein n=1 Tax=Lamprobacter sp. TaxID=3100796 RepID=UPI002B259D19|nr:hypothetical protein [Lamprobacter sp.]MEA3642305.1 hypothetical protein [Lamprobacter sp.]